MVYQPSIPLATDKQRISQSDIKTNFGDLDTLFDVDHVKWSDATGDAGKHSATTFVNRTDKVLTIPPVTTAQELAMYVKDDSAGIPRIFYQEPDSAGAGAEVQISGKVKSGANGEAPLAGGMGLKWGQATVAENVSTAFTYAGDFTQTAFAVETRSLNITPVSASSVQTFRIVSSSATGFTVQIGASVYPCTFHFQAIGS